MDVDGWEKDTFTMAVLSAVCDPRQEALDQICKTFPTFTFSITTDPESVLSSNDIDAVVIATATSTHVDLTLRAIKAGKHVLLEKPISIDLKSSRPVIAASEARPEVKVMVGFPRRFDDDYREAYDRLTSNGLGGPAYQIKSNMHDTYNPDTIDFTLAYSKVSGGIFMDAAIHDIDVSRWFLDVANPARLPNPKKQVNRVWGIGQTVRYDAMREWGDSDNALGTIEFANGSQAIVHVNRINGYGHQCSVEIFGPTGNININPVPFKSRVEIRDAHGVRHETQFSWLDRLTVGFVNEMNYFVECVLDGKPNVGVAAGNPVPPREAFEASKIGAALMHSLHTGSPVVFDEEGEPIMS
ncbi:hypothetical protein D1P53_002215 [Cryptococcus gattii VGV]|nr:hypothetical protein D1P53_002215 [Cryptococcus gattii VGV]